MPRLWAHVLLCRVERRGVVLCHGGAGGDSRPATCPSSPSSATGRWTIPVRLASSTTMRWRCATWWMLTWVDTAQEALDTALMAWRLAEDRRVLLPIAIGMY